MASVPNSPSPLHAVDVDGTDHDGEEEESKSEPRRKEDEDVEVDVATSGTEDECEGDWKERIKHFRIKIKSCMGLGKRPSVYQPNLCMGYRQHSRVR